MFWFNFAGGHANLHREDCRAYRNRKTPSNWRGPYASRGAAIDAALHLDRIPWESQDCIRSKRVNTE